MTKALERKFDLSLAINNAIRLYKEESLSFYAEKTFLLPNIFTTSVYVESDTYDFATQGNGKGIGEQSYASALYEGLEHYFSERYDYQGNSEKKVLKDVIEQRAVLKCEAPLNEMYVSDPVQSIKCMQFQEIQGERSLWYPSFLIFPAIADVSNEYLCYASNNGIAVGTDLNEALLHSLCELVERHSISKAMIKLLQSPKTRFNSIDVSSVPHDLCEILLEMNKQYGTISIYEITTIPELPVYMTVLNCEKSKMPICGYGCSLSSRYALERSILECLQCAHLYSDTERIEDDSVLRYFAPSKEITDMLLLRNIKRRKSNFSENIINMSVDEMLNRVVSLLKKEGYEQYYRIIFCSDTLVCVKAIVPGFEKFHLIRSGCPVCANSKG